MAERPYATSKAVIPSRARVAAPGYARSTMDAHTMMMQRGVEPPILIKA